MAFSPPNSFAASTRLVASTWTGNADALRVYLHSGIVASDIATGDWADTRHIAGPPVIDTTSGIQHGVTGHQGGLSSRASLSRLTFTTQAQNSTVSGRAWAPIPLTSIRIEVRRRSDIILSWWSELLVGPDDRSGTRNAWIGYYVSQAVFTSGAQSHVAPSNANGFDSSTPRKVMPDLPWEFSGWHDADGTAVTHRYADNFVGVATLGLAAFSNVTRTAVLNWGVTVESYT